MQHPSVVRSVLVAAVLALVGACADSPAGPREPGPLFRDQRPTSPLTVAPGVGVGDANGGSIVERDVTAPDGQRYRVRERRDGTGALVETAIMQEGKVIVRSVSEWDRSGDALTLSRQRVFVARGAGEVAAFDSRDQGGITQGDGKSLQRKVIGARELAYRRLRESGLASFSYDEMVCEKELRNYELAYRAYNTSLFVFAGALATGNPAIAGPAGSAVLSAYKAMDWAEQDLNSCIRIDAARKRYTPDEV
ncbi:MAG: hypothetical protein K2X99_04985 [Gemmatimonadaceae bacterium]|nr:hypothetical protein [Gemmatimonadaceae bacterium]